MLQNSVKKICVVTTSRADYGLLYYTLKAISASKKLNLQLIVSGTHLSKKHGYTLKYILSDGFKPARKISILNNSNDIESVGITSGTAVSKFTKAFLDLKPDAILLLGDRYETLAAAFAATICVIPVVHLHGGEISEGANDDMYRHAITKMSALHFTSTTQYRKRVIQMGEQPNKVIVSGALGIENIKKMKLLDKSELQVELGIKFNKNIFLVTFHPATMEKIPAKAQVVNVLNCLKKQEDATFIITMANADAQGEAINREIAKFGLNNKNCYITASLGQLKYLSAMKHCTLVVGNSSSGILEAPSFNKPVVNIGSRQNGRIKASSVFDCDSNEKSITLAIKKALAWNKKGIKISNPYDSGDSSRIIVKTLERCRFDRLLPKPFYDVKY